MNELTQNDADRENTNGINNREFDTGLIDDFAARVSDGGFSLPPPLPDSSLISTAVHPETHSTCKSANIYPCPTSSWNKSQFTSKHLSLTLSNIYALFVIILGVIIYTGDFFYQVTFSPIYSLVLLAIGLVYLVYLIIDINIYNWKLNKIKSKRDENAHNIETENTQNGNYVVDLRHNHTDLLPKLTPEAVSYQFTHGRHSGSFYLKLGATGFAIGHLIHSILVISSQFHYFQDDNLDNDVCLSITGAIHDLFNPLFCFLQLYFIFNYSNIVILKHPRLAYLGFIHLIATSLCFWISTIYRETLLSLYIYANSKYGNKTTGGNTAVKDHSDKSLVDLESLYNANCTGSPASIMIFESFSPYLFPFGVEFNILIVAFYYIIWSNIGNPIESEDHTLLDTDHHSLHSIDDATEHESHTRNIVVLVDCHGSSKGLFFGLLFVVIVASNIILGFVFGNLGGKFIELGYSVKNGTKLGMHLLMTIAVIIAYKQSRSLDVNEHPISMLDDVFLYICLPAFFMETLLSMVATINILNIVRSVDFVIMTLQVVLQTVFIIDGLRRCSNSRRLRRNKPGRDVVMFLLIANVCMWLFNTFSYKSPESIDERYEFYGKVLWTILGHITLPLMMFYRFHSSVCLADIWDTVYKPGSSH